ncbi:uncharacterized protein BJ212DRAFT_166448 [Suillus subaureus]|uniref:Uncharacterized protein n=1 Tax=Suillus subaureus TaxID=48587 RepID=A0A9P7EBQ4_9AGAM|nr:uncharacterized protein BJ212DRAFT_166448 [Suillus subaureus]KAG1816662.1 hypothetical protein BJ212DRAFT_166448 [Suillus subaureus]
MPLPLNQMTASPSQERGPRHGCSCRVSNAILSGASNQVFLYASAFDSLIFYLVVVAVISPTPSPYQSSLPTSFILAVLVSGLCTVRLVTSCILVRFQNG